MRMPIKSGEVSMGNRAIAFASLIAFQFIFLICSVSKAANPTTAACGTAGGYEAVSYKLDYVGLKFDSTGVECVEGFDDNTAIANCKKKYPNGNFRVINPGNPQYTEELSFAANGKSGSLSKNALGFYLCYPGNKNDKKAMCQRLKSNPSESDYNNSLSPTDKNFVNFEWIPSGSDGDCKCSFPNDKNKSATFNCSQTKPVNPESVAGSGEDFKKKCEEKLAGTYSVDGPSCFCKEGTKIIGSVNVYEDIKCENKANPTTKTPDADKPSQKMVECINKWKKISENCNSSAAKANVRCDPVNQDNPEVDNAMKIPGQIASTFAQANAGKGMASECLKAGIISNSTDIAMKTMKESCDEESKICNDNCGEEKPKEFYNECKQLLADESKIQGDDEGDGNANQKYLAANQDEINKNFINGTPICKVDAKKKSGLFNDLLNGLAKSLRAGAICSCQMAASIAGQSAVGCSSIPPVDVCKENPSLEICKQGYGIIDICSIGSKDYSYDGCKCQGDPKAPGCSAFVSARPNNSGFAGPDAKMPSAGGAGIGPATGGGSGNGGPLGLNLSSPKEDDASNGAKANAAGPGYLGGAPGGGAGGGGGGSGGGGDGGPGEGAKEADGGSGNSGGIFGQAKSFMGNLFGGGKSNAVGGKATANKIDTDKFKPKGSRGVAGNSAFGSKNMDIWLMMNNRYDNEANQNTFISAP
jgi:hypothetical protein